MIEYKKARPVTIGHLSFNSKAKAKEYFRDIKNRNKDTELSGQDLIDVKELFKYGFESLTAPENISVSPDGFGDYCFQYDNKKNRFSFNNAIDGEPSKFYRFNAACRESIKSQIFEFRKLYQTKDGQHVDHEVPYFSQIVDMFICGLGINVNEVILEEYNNVFNLPADLNEKFNKWHKRKAKLRMLDATENLKLACLAKRK